MANTTDLMITVFFDENVINEINQKTGLDFKRITDGEKSGGAKILSFEVFGTCPRCIGRQKILLLIKIFKCANFESPEYAKLFIDCDNEDSLDGVYSVG